MEGYARTVRSHYSPFPLTEPCTAEGGAGQMLDDQILAVIRH